MKKIEEFDLSDAVRPVTQTFYSDNGLIMSQDENYFVYKFHKVDALYGTDLQVPYAVVKDKKGLHYAINYGRVMIGTEEDVPSVKEVIALPDHCWNNRNKQMLAALASSLKPLAGITKSTEARKGEFVEFDIEKISTMRIKRQALQILQILIRDGQKKFSPAEVIDKLTKNADQIGSKQDVWALFKAFDKNIYGPSGLTRWVKEK